MRDRFLRAVAGALERARKRVAEASGSPPASPSWSGWIGRPVVDHDGVRLGHVVRVTSDGIAGAWLRVSSDWGVLDWLPALGAAGHPTFTFHSDDVVEENGKLVLRPISAAR
jgi:hypothetical protein